MADDNPPKYGSIAANRAVTVTTPQNKHVPNSLQKLFGTCCFFEEIGLYYPTIGQRLLNNFNEIIGKNGRDCRAIPPLLQIHSKEGDREGTVHVDRKGAARGDAS
ncbi:hypothetical protein [Segatella oulorum]|uniref:hypothetical protein n=1 Tax=Segatella oulorum TaxID=28136 RepID=UPI0028EBF3BD|nr:hypothetical protein [Segatella oulorum]